MTVLLVGALIEGGLAVLAWGLGLLVGRSPWSGLRWDLRDAALGIAATLPMLLALRLGARSAWPPLARIRRLFDEEVRPALEPCTTTDLALIALAAGVGEEAMFRGVLQAALAGWLGPGPGLVVASGLFGLLHPITPAYIVFAALMGAYLGGLWMAVGNLLTPIAAHALYDFVALIYLLRVRPRAGP